MRKKIKTFLKIGISFGLLLFVLSQIDINKLLATLQKSNPWWLLAAFVFFNLSKIISSVRLNYYFKDIGVYLKEKDALILYYVGMFYNLFLPGGIGGDGYKIYLLQKVHAPGVKELIQATLLDRLSGLAALLFLAGTLFLFSSYAALYPPLAWLALAGAILVYPIFLFLHKTIFKRFLTYIVQTTLLGLSVQILQLLCAFSLVYALGISQHLIDYLTLFLISSVVAVLPLTIGGVGAREFTFLYGLKLLHQDPSTGIAFSFLFFMITAISSAIGLFFVHNPLQLNE
ncbi:MULTISPECIES: lysylphosphatidylglycerol synthase transmembrane domain-containing protein [unclassified Nitratiruptor]|uniref:lysylphosphatidylglycerol synthase transmembrane domain-containing protein n=1 Tax=unclassified Nitratiruptor TaxID=2624044 RepID=UPI001916A219|nr:MULTISPECIES: lysylphosphatidylglycerol synthase transmembrane domain-containing protein [unclassified Nitratiruptor]BCD60163.1 glycosyltransferase 2 family protein [Nitratiruptor sp. YY08-10]BCD64348.1 glycosyltransferase 2 family protein [Nitratiruptor sp. YY08-14]